VIYFTPYNNDEDFLGQPCPCCGHDINDDNHVCNFARTKLQQEELELLYAQKQWPTLYDSLCG